LKKIIFGFLFLFTVTDSKSQDSTYIWPTNSGRFLSSTFGETRSAHFHAGLDIKTWGREGYKVYATKDGVLSRLLITNKGYGKAIYLKHEDGFYTVYAHLQRFNKDFQAIADSVRLLDYSYTFEEFLEPENIQVKKGDVIGYTGSTGVGPPHLHYEIRNADNQPLNPLSFDFSIEDTLSPVFSSVLVEPLEINSRVSNSVYPKTIRPIATKNDTTYFDTVAVNGKVGFSPYVYDRANDVYNKYAVYELALLFNGDTLYHELLDSFDFSETDAMFFNRVPELNSDRRKFQRLFPANQFLNPFIVSTNFKRTLSPGLYYIIAKDYYGNRSVAEIPIKKATDSSTHAIKNSFEKWNYDWVSIDESTNVNLKDFSEGVLWDSTAQHRILNYGESSIKTLARIEPEKSYSIISPNQAIRLFVEPNSFFDTLSIVQETIVQPDSISFILKSPDTIYRKPIRIQLYLGEHLNEKKNLNLYSVTENGRRNFIDSWITGSTINALIDSPGNFTVLSDTLAPVISDPQKIKLGDGQNSYSIFTTDDLSGIDYKTALFMIDGIRGIAEYDYENDSFLFYLPKINVSKGSSIYFEVKDKAGNYSKKNFLLRN